MKTIIPRAEFALDVNKLNQHPNPQELIEIVSNLIRGDVKGDAGPLDNYLILTNDSHKRSVRMTVKEIAKKSIPGAFSWGVGGASAYGYVGYAQMAAGNNEFNYYANPAGAFTLNFIVNGYFFNLVVSSLWEYLITTKPFEVQRAIDILQGLTPGFIGKIQRYGKNLGLVTLILTPSLFSAIPAYYIDKAGGDSEMMAIVVLLSTTMLQYKGVEATIYKAIPALFSPIKMLYRRYNLQAQTEYKIQTTIGLLKDAHLQALSATRQQVLKLIQTGQSETLDEIYDLIMLEDPSKHESAILLIKLLELAKTEEYQSSPRIRKAVQAASVVLTLASVPGFYLKTVIETGNLLEWGDLLNWVVGTAIYLISATLAIDVGWLVGGDIYDLLSYASNGVIRTRKQATSWSDFFSLNIKNRLYDLIQLPLSIVQNPGTMGALLTCLYGMSYWSTQTSTYLNEETLGPEVSEYFLFPTIASIILFNIFPVDKVLGSAQQFIMRSLCTSNKLQDSRLFKWFVGEPARSLSEIKLEQFLLEQQSIAAATTDEMFLHVLDNIAGNRDLTKEQAELFLERFLGNKKPADIFGEDSTYGQQQFRKIVKCLAKNNTKELRRFGLFTQERAERKHLLINAEEGYGTRSNGNHETSFKYGFNSNGHT